MSDLTAEGILEAWRGLTGSQMVGERMTTIINAALAYADLLEKAEKVWICDHDGYYPTDPKKAWWCRYKGDERPHTNCGWRLLVRGEQ